MEISGNTLLVLAAILFFGLIVPNFFRKVELPLATSLILLGSLLGPYGLNYVQPDETMDLFGFLGAAFYMMLSGFEVEVPHFTRSIQRFWLLFLSSTLIPFAVGTGIAWLFNYSLTTSFFMGAVFVSSSILTVFSSVKALGIGEGPLGRTIKSLAVAQDFTGLLLIFLIFKYIEPHQRFSLPILLGLLLSSVVILRMFLPEVVRYFFHRFERRKEGHEAESRLVIALLLVVIVLYSALDVHPVIAAFLVGFTLTEVPHSDALHDKLHTIGHTLFIPIFLFVIGVGINLKVLTSLTSGDFLFPVLLGGAFLSKYISTHLGARFSGFSARESVFLGISSTAKLTVTLSAAYAALSIGLINNRLYTVVVLVSVVSILVSPALLALSLKKWKRHLL